MEEAIHNERQILELLRNIFAEAGWDALFPEHQARDQRVDLILERGNASYLLELKRISEGRSDRLIPAWSQAYLQARHYAHPDQRPLAVIAAPQISDRAADQLLRFANDYAPEAAVGVIDFQGMRRFRGAGLEGLDSDRQHDNRPVQKRKRANLFSDLNQWMLKLLIAPDISSEFLSAPRKRYRNPSALAEYANVSVMSAYRFVEQLSSEGYVNNSSQFIELVRRRNLFERWRSVAAEDNVDIPVKFLLKSDLDKELRKILSGRPDRCLGLFVAAAALGLGFVSGVPPYVYVSNSARLEILRMRNIRLAEHNEAPDIILRQPRAPKSVFRAAVIKDEMPVSDIVQVWLDVSNHPSRGVEQADLIQREVLEPILLNAHG